MPESNKHPQKMDRVLQVIQAAGVAFTALSAGIALSEYFDIAEQDRKNRIFSYFKEYNSIPMIEMRSRLLFKRSEYARRKHAHNELVYKTMVEDLTSWIEKNEKNFTAYNAVVSFFDTIHACVKANGCDKNLYEKLFSVDAQEYFYFLYGYLVAQNDKRYSNGIGMTCLVAKIRTREVFNKITTSRRVDRDRKIGSEARIQSKKFQLDVYGQKILKLCEQYSRQYV